MSSRLFKRHLPARFALALALCLPASAIAAPAAEGPSSPRPADAESPPGVVDFVVAVGTVLAESAADDGPFNPVSAPVDYGTAINRFGGGGMRTHEGQDMFAPMGTPVVSPVATTVLETGTDGGRGNWAALYDAESDRTFIYMHMEAPADPKAGQKLEAGDRVGRLGCTGSCDGAHLHFEIRAGRDPYGQPSDPLAELKSWQTPPAG